MPTGPSNAQFSFTSATLSAEGSSLPTAPVALGNEDNARFSFTSGTLPARESSLPTAPFVFRNESKAQFSLNSGANPAEGSSLAAQPLVFGVQPDAQFSFTSGTVPAEGSSLPAEPSIFGIQSNAQPALDSGTQPEEESIEKMVADIEAELAKSSGLLGNTHNPHDPNYGLDMAFGLDTGFIPSTPNVDQDSNETQYPDPSVPDFGRSLSYPTQDSNIRDPDLPHSSFIPGLDVAQHPSFDQKLDFPLDPSLDLADENSNWPPFAASIQSPAVLSILIQTLKMIRAPYRTSFRIQHSRSRFASLQLLSRSQLYSRSRHRSRSRRSRSKLRPKAKLPSRSEFRLSK